MSANSSKNNHHRVRALGVLRRHSWLRKLLLALGYSAWVVVSFVAGSVLTVVLLKLLIALGVPYFSLGQAARSSIEAALSFTLSLLVAVWLPARIRRKQPVSTTLLGLQKPLSWYDLVLGVLAFVPYIIGAVIVTTIAQAVIPGFDTNQKQDVGFDQLYSQMQYILAFMTLVVMAPIAEEILFRGYLYGKLRRHMGIVVTSLVVSALFGLLHMQWNVGVNVFALSLVLCGLREFTGSVWAGIVLHMVKNGIAFYALYLGHIW